MRPEFITVGTVVNAHGVRGDGALRCGNTLRLCGGCHILLGQAQGADEAKVVKARLAQVILSGQ